MKQSLRFLLIFLLPLHLLAQGENRSDRIRSVQLYRSGDPTSLAALPLGATDGMELHFDDLDNRVRNYYYTFQLCNVDWTPSNLNPFDYLRGFQNIRITNYRNSSLAMTRYIHYQAPVPDRNCYPTRSGNYLLRVFLDNDTSKTVFTRRMVIYDNKAEITAQVQQPFNATLFRTAQKLNVGVKIDSRVQVMSPNDLKVVILQNNNWQTSLFLDRPTIYRGNYFEYSDEAVTAMSAGREFRWVDLRSLRLKSDRVASINNRGDTTKVEVRADPNRRDQVYVYYRDLNGSFTIEALENINPYWQGDYAEVKFTYVPAGNRQLQGEDLYLFGQMTNWAADTSGRMEFNKELGVYERTLFLKQGFYNYVYVSKPTSGKGPLDFGSLEGNYFGTENTYTVLIYNRPFGARADELIGAATLSSLFNVR